MLFEILLTVLLYIENGVKLTSNHEINICDCQVTEYTTVKSDTMTLIFKFILFETISEPNCLCLESFRLLQVLQGQRLPSLQASSWV